MLCRDGADAACGLPEPLLGDVEGLADNGRDDARDSAAARGVEQDLVREKITRLIERDSGQVWSAVAVDVGDDRSVVDSRRHEAQWTESPVRAAETQSHAVTEQCVGQQI